jgi:hypothetical protein
MSGKPSFPIKEVLFKLFKIFALLEVIFRLKLSVVLRF